MGEYWLSNYTNKPTKLKISRCINIAEGYRWECPNKGNVVVINNSYISYEKYKAKKEQNRLGDFNIGNDRIHQELCRLALVDNLVDEFHWDYWMVVTFGFHPQRSDVENILRDTHHRFDQWLRTNNQLNFLSVAERSKWVCLPERGGDGHLHYNCFLQLNIQPEVKTHGSEWKAIRYALNKSFEAVGKAKNKKIDFKVYERKRDKDRLRQSIYSTKEMTQRHIDENHGEDHFASYIRSWTDWQIQPLTPRSGKKIKEYDDTSGTLDQFFQ